MLSPSLEVQGVASQLEAEDYGLFMTKIHFMLFAEIKSNQIYPLFRTLSPYRPALFPFLP